MVCFILALRAAFPAAVPPLATLLLLLLLFYLIVAHLTDPLLLGGADIVDHRLVFRARVAHQEAALATVVTACGDGEFCKAAEAPLGVAVWDPGDGEGGGGPIEGALQ